MKIKTGRVDCECGDQIISNSGKAMHKFPNMAFCWNPRCHRVYDYDAVENARINNHAAVFESPGKNLKIFKMNECDWWMDHNLADAIINYSEFIMIPSDECTDEPCEVGFGGLKRLKYHDVELDVSCSFFEELQRRQSISNEPEFFASTEF